MTRNKLLLTLSTICLSLGVIVGITSQEIKKSYASEAATFVLESEAIESNDIVTFVSDKFALGPYNSGNYYSKIEVDIKDGTFTGTPTELTVVENDDDTFSFLTQDNQYISCGSDGNVMNLQTTIDNYSKWVVTFDEKTNNTTIKNCKYTARVIQYNSNSPRFACYKGTQNAIQIYKKEISSANLVSIDVSDDYKSEYYTGELIKKSDMTVTANFDDGTSKVVEGFTFTPTTPLTVEDTMMTVSYAVRGTTKTKDLPITVTRDEAIEIIIPDDIKTQYYVGDDPIFNSECDINYLSGKTEKHIPAADFSKVNKNAPGTYEVTLTYEEATETYNVTYVISTKAKYTLVTSLDDIEDTTELILGVPSKKVVNASFNKDGLNSIANVEYDNAFYLDNAVTLNLVKHDTSYYLMLNDKKIGASAAKTLTLDNDKATNTWKVSFDEENNCAIESTNSSFGKLFYNNDSKVFKNYTSSTMTKIQLFKKLSETKSATLSIDEFEGNVRESTEVQVITKNFTPNEFNWECDDHSVASIIDTDESTNTITIVGEGECFINVDVYGTEHEHFELSLKVIGHDYQHDVIEDGSKLIITYEETKDIMNPVNGLNIPNAEFTPNQEWTFEAVGKGDDVYAITNGVEYLSSHSNDAKNSLTETMTDWFYITESFDKFTIKSLVNNKYLVHFKDGQNKIQWYFFNSGFETINQLTLTHSMELKDVYINGVPDKLVYEPGDKFEIAPAKVIAKYYSSEEGWIEKDVTSQVSWSEIDDITDEVEGTVVLGGEEWTVTQPITVLNLHVEELYLTPNKTEFYIGESVTKDDVKVEALLVEEDEKCDDIIKEIPLSECEVTPSKFTSSSQTTVTVSYMDVEASYNVTVKDVRFDYAESVTNGDQVVFVCEDFGVEMDGPTGSSEFGFTPAGKTVFEIEKGSETGSKSFKEIETGKYLALDGSKLTLSETKNSASSWTITINHGEAFIWSVYASDKFITFNGDSMKFTTTASYPYAIQLYKDVTINVPESISVSQMPDKTIFEVGDEFIYEGLKIKVNYGGGAFKIIDTGFNVETPDMSSAGTKVVKVSYQGVETSYNIIVNTPVGPVYPVGLVVSNTKTEFYVGDEFVFNGTVQLKMSDESMKTLTADEYKVYGLDSHSMSVAGIKDVKVEYKNDPAIFTTYKITVNSIKPTLERIEVKNPQIAYEIGDSFVKPTVIAYYDDESEVDVTASATFSGYNMSAVGSQTVRVSFENKTTSYSIFVNGVVTISIENPKTTYTQGESFVMPTVIAHYANGTIKDVTNDATHNFDKTKLGEQTVTIMYTEKGITVATTIKVTVNAPAPSKGGCGGSIVATSAVLSFTSLLAIGFALINKKRHK